LLTTSSAIMPPIAIRLRMPRWLLAPRFRLPVAGLRLAVLGCCRSLPVPGLRFAGLGCGRRPPVLGFRSAVLSFALPVPGLGGGVRRPSLPRLHPGPGRRLGPGLGPGWGLGFTLVIATSG
jgi:hypothetical protein